MKKALILLFLSISFNNHAQEFELQGEFKGSNTKEIIIKYIDLKNQNISDTLQINDGRFKTGGQIKGTQRVLIIGNTEIKSFDDPNLGYFFLEPGKVEIKLEENNLKNPEVLNSPTQSEYQKIYRKSLKILSEVDSLSKIQADRALITEKFEEMKNLELNYAIANPSSLLSAYYIQFYMRQMPEDSLKQYYDKMSLANKNSIYGEAIHELLNNTVVNTNDRAPDFEMTDLTGETISMKDFKGKYLLLDFWANWCAPCIKELPKIKSFHKKYGSKGLEILGVSFDQNKEQWRKGVYKHNMENWNQVFVGLNDIRSTGSISEKYDIQPIPAYIFIDKEGRIIGRYSNASDENKSLDDLAKNLEKIFKN